MTGSHSAHRRARFGLISAIGAAAVLAIGAVSASAADGVALNGHVAAGEPTSSSVILWTKAPAAGPVMAQARKTGSGDFLPCVLTKAGATAAARQRKGVEWIGLVNAATASDLTAQVKLTGLQPGSSYDYRFCAAGDWTSNVGSFNSGPSPSSTSPVSFAWSGDMDASPSPTFPTPSHTNGAYWNSFETLATMNGQNNDFNIIMGDTIYSDSEVPGVSPNALSVDQKRAKYVTNLEMPAYQELRASSGLFNHWDDHEFINDFSPKETPGQLGIDIPTKQLYANGVKAFREFMPVPYAKKTGIYRHVRYGKNLELFFLDERSFRSASSDEIAACLNEGSPDLAPTAPSSTRSVFSLVVPALANPVKKACLASINSRSRTMLGKTQLARFLKDVKASKATFKVVMNEVPMQQYYALPYDRWEGYAAERTQVLNALNKVKNTVVLSTDVHATLVNNIRYATLPTVRNSKVSEATVGPIATKNYGLEMDDATGSAGTGDLIQQVFYKAPAPPGSGAFGPGMGMQCSSTDQFGFGQVQVTPTALTINFFDQDGSQTTEFNGDNPRQACASLTIPKR